MLSQQAVFLTTKGGFTQNRFTEKKYDGDFNIKPHMLVKFHLVASLAAVVLRDVPVEKIQSVECFR